MVATAMAVAITVIVPALGAFDTTAPSEAVEIYCVKSKAKTASRDIKAVTMKNGDPPPGQFAWSAAPESSASASRPERFVHPIIMALDLGLTTHQLLSAPQRSLRAKKTQCSMGLGSVKYMTPPSSPPSAGITLNPRCARRATTSSGSYSRKARSAP